VYCQSESRTDEWTLIVEFCSRVFCAELAVFEGDGGVGACMGVDAGWLCKYEV
jgi:hypothetical protein